MQAIAQAEALMRAHGITLVGHRDAELLAAAVPHRRNHLAPNQPLSAVDREDGLPACARSIRLFQQEVIGMEEYNLRRGLFKRQVKRFYYACRRCDESLRGRMDAHAGRNREGARSVSGARRSRSRSPPPRIRQPHAAQAAEAGRRSRARRHSAAPPSTGCRGGAARSDRRRDADRPNRFGADGPSARSPGEGTDRPRPAGVS